MTAAAIKRSLEKSRRKIETFMGAFFESRSAGLAAVNSWGADFVERIRPFTTGGKMIRGGLIWMAHDQYGAGSRRTIDRKIAARALPVLRAILDGEKDGELRDRARIAVMRIDPSRLAGMDRREKGAAGGMLKIRIYSRVERKEKVSLSIPLGLADLALQALGAEEKRTLQKEGYDLDEILEQLTGKGLKIDIQGDNEVMQIWVE